jgi:hypothetical protein
MTERWVFAATVSLAAHVALAAALVVALRPEPVPPPERMEARLRMASEPVRRSEAAEADPGAERAPEADGDSARVGAAAVRRDRAEPLSGAALGAPAEAVAAGSRAATPMEPRGPATEPLAPSGNRASSVRAAGKAAAPVSPDAGSPAPPASLPADRLAADAPEPAARVAAVRAPGEPAAASLPAAASTTAIAPAPAASGAVTPAPAASRPLAGARPEAARAATATLTGDPAAAVSPAAGRIEPVPAGRGAAAGSAVYPASPRAAPTALAEARADAVALPGEAVGAAAAASERAPPAEPPSRRAAPSVMEAEASREAAPSPEAALTAVARGAPARVALPKGEIAAAAMPDAPRVGSAPASGTTAAPRRPDAEAPAYVSSTRLARAAGARPPADIATRASAGLAWSGDAAARFDALSLATVQSFMAPRRAEASGMHGGDVRDGISAFLARFPCSRLQAAFVPETGGLEVRGHVPRPELRAEVEARLSGMIGGAIEVGGDIALLPEPQCNLLGAVSALGLPQSTDQADDPLVVGQAAQARVFAVAGGETLHMDLGGADYPAFIYVDYYDSAGNVLHLVPNEHVPLRRVGAEAPVRIGEGNPDFEGLALVVEPPYGRDIAVAIAASRPLYEGLRPLVEPAEPYLDWLRERVAEAREAPGFRGEWVYFFVDTRPPE